MTRYWPLHREPEPGVVSEAADLVRHSPPAVRKIEGLDFIRAFAAVNVTLFHLTGVYGTSFGFKDTVYFQVHASIGIPLFFVLTGYLIPPAFARSTPPAIIEKRYVRLLPALFVCSLLTVATLLLFPFPERYPTPSIFTWIVNLTMLPKMVGVEFLDGQYWSLQAQMCFLLFLCLCALMRLRDYLVIVVNILLVYAMVLYGFGLHLVVYDLPQISKILINNFLTLFQLPYLRFFAVGIFIYCLHRKRLTPSVYLMILLTIFHEVVIPRNGVLLFAVTGAIVAAHIFWTPFYAKWRIVRFFANISYSLFLLHLAIGWIAIRELESIGINSNAVLAIALTGLVGLSALVHYYFEMPLYRFLRRHRYFKDKSPSPV
ncbi:MAG: acyltransferase [Opitutales bacterium]|nr:acyltransferase [Opitutales bacterium]